MIALGPDAIAVCAMGKDVYLDQAGGWIDELRAAGLPVADLRASMIDRTGMLDALDAGPGLVLYAGHGRSRGWAGYQTVRWAHLEARPPGLAVGVVIALACETLAPGSREPLSFGERLVHEGRAHAYVGSVTSLQIVDGIALARYLIPALAGGRSADVGSLLLDLAATVQREQDAAAARALQTLRLVGEARTPLPTVQARLAAAA